MVFGRNMKWHITIPHSWGKGGAYTARQSIVDWHHLEHNADMLVTWHINGLSWRCIKLWQTLLSLIRGLREILMLSNLRTSAEPQLGRKVRDDKATIYKSLKRASGTKWQWLSEWPPRWWHIESLYQTKTVVDSRIPELEFWAYSPPGRPPEF